MSECCSNKSICTASDTKIPSKLKCPRCGDLGTIVTFETMNHHLQNPWSWEPKAHSYYFCESVNCDVVYFSEKDDLVKTDDVRTLIGVKNEIPESLVCYCYGVTRKMAEEIDEAKLFVIEQTKNGSCSCVTQNPSGRCCLKGW